jgi:hypothetical protein
LSRARACGEIRPHEDIALTEITETTKTAAVPTAAEIDTLLGLYLDADQNVKSAIEQRDVFGEQIEEMIAAHGFLPPRAKKSKRIQGEEYKATFGQSHSVDVDSTAVRRLFSYMKEWGLARFFRKLYKREEIFVLADDAQELIAKLATKPSGFAGQLQLLFAQTLRIEGRSTSLKVEPIKEEKKKAEKKNEAAA